MAYGYLVVSKLNSWMGVYLF